MPPPTTTTSSRLGTRGLLSTPYRGGRRRILGSPRCTPAQALRSASRSTEPRSSASVPASVTPPPRSWTRSPHTMSSTSWCTPSPCGAAPNSLRCCRPASSAATQPFPARLARALWQRNASPRIERWTGPVDVVHATNFVAPPARAPVVVTVHDLTFARRPDLADAATRDYDTLIRRALDRGAVVHTVSDYVAAAVREEYALPCERVVRIYPGLHARGSATRPPAAATSAPTATRCSSGRSNPGRTFPRLVRAFHRVADSDPDLRLVLAGPPGPDTDNVERAVTDGPHGDRVVRTGYVSDQARLDLLAGSTVFVFPSLDEGFGHPPLDAMAAGVPVVAAAAGAIPEVLGDSALLVDPTDVVVLADAIEQVLQRRLDARHARRAGQSAMAESTRGRRPRVSSRRSTATWRGHSRRHARCRHWRARIRRSSTSPRTSTRWATTSRSSTASAPTGSTSSTPTRCSVGSATFAPDVVYHLAARTPRWCVVERRGRCAPGQRRRHRQRARGLRRGGRRASRRRRQRRGVRPHRLRPRCRCRETTPLQPVSPYARSKVAAEALALAAQRDGSVDVICVRAFNHTGPGQSPNFLVPGLATRIAAAERDGADDIVVGNLDSVRDYTDVRDVVRAYRLLADPRPAGRGLQRVLRTRRHRRRYRRRPRRARPPSAPARGRPRPRATRRHADTRRRSDSSPRGDGLDTGDPARAHTRRRARPRAPRPAARWLRGPDGRASRAAWRWRGDRDADGVPLLAPAGARQAEHPLRRGRARRRPGRRDRRSRAARGAGAHRVDARPRPRRRARPPGPIAARREGKPGVRIMPISRACASMCAGSRAQSRNVLGAAMVATPRTRSSDAASQTANVPPWPKPASHTARTPSRAASAVTAARRSSSQPAAEKSPSDLPVPRKLNVSTTNPASRAMWSASSGYVVPTAVAPRGSSGRP